MTGIVIFTDAHAAIRAGFMIESPIPDQNGFLHARTQTERGWAKALISLKTTLSR